MDARSATTYPPVTDELLAEVVRRIRAVGNPIKIVMFGSRARGEARPDSDLDLLIVEESDLPRHRRSVPYYCALAALFPSKDIVVWTPNEIHEWSEVSNHFVTVALREGRVLYARQPQQFKKGASSVNGPREHARGWIGKGDSDLKTARLITQGDGPLDTACFHCQQAAEKYLKALLAAKDEGIPHTHDLAALLNACCLLYGQLGLEQHEVAGLTDYAVKVRYDLTFAPDQSELDQAIRTAEVVRTAVLALLPQDASPKDQTPQPEGSAT
jgi:predicted nucleotidyltransferase